MQPTGRRRELTGAQSFFALLAAVLLTFAAHNGYYAWRGWDDFDKWAVARPMSTKIDLSQPQQITLPFHQTCSISHGEGFYLDAPQLSDEDKQDLPTLFAGLDGSIEICDTAGNIVSSVEMHDEYVYYWDDQIMLAKLDPFEEGEYQATILIRSGATKLAGIDQTLLAAYQLCGLERLAVTMSAVIGGVSGVVGLLIAGGVWSSWRSIPRDSPPDNADSEKPSEPAAVSVND
ncbi:hypothetical protein [Aeoliella mucimassa]|uniref:Uncharacterized protein n=1 Tax=Aeoliella mucimassa TaxID=2527972 RepID=A0A518AKR2_9BACT|nr:hypothetical protein [Aeoliella mucimassa]QDU55307.1 hypothetical protein Pan181_14960 [Aeoliella mucimassa]